MKIVNKRRGVRASPFVLKENKTPQYKTKKKP